MFLKSIKKSFQQCNLIKAFYCTTQKKIVSKGFTYFDDHRYSVKKNDRSI